MKPNNIPFRHLRHEMKERRLTETYMAEELGWNRHTLCRKLNRVYSMKLEEAVRVWAMFFNDCSFEYLFSEIFEETSEAVSAPHSF